jgi:hypothetical protein
MPRTTLDVVHISLKAPQAGALLVGTRSRRSRHELVDVVVEAVVYAVDVC